MKLYSKKISNQFKENQGLDKYSFVLICAQNEQHDLPRLLYSLSKSIHPLVPIIVDNNSSDNTNKYGTLLAPIVIREERSGLIYALETGFKYISQLDCEVKYILLTDADSYPLKTWAKTLIEKTKGLGERGGQIFGPVYYWGGVLKGLVLTRSNLVKDRELQEGGFIKARGPNSIIATDPNGEIIKTLSNNFDPKIIIGTDEYIKDLVSMAGGDIIRDWDYSGSVFSRADRYKSVYQLYQIFVRRNGRYESLYNSWYEGREGHRYISPSRPSSVKF